MNSSRGVSIAASTQACFALGCILLSGIVIPNYPAARSVQTFKLLSAGVLALLFILKKLNAHDKTGKAATASAAVLSAMLGIVEIRFFLPRVLEADPFIASYYVLAMAQNMLWCYTLAYALRPGISIPYLALTLTAFIFLYFKLSAGGLFLLFFLIVATLGGFGVFMLLASLREQHRREQAWMMERERLYGELENAEERLLEEAGRAAASSLSAEIVHEIQNPINFMAGNLPFLEESIDALVSRAAPEQTDIAEIGAILTRFKEGLELITLAIARARNSALPASAAQATAFNPETAIGRAVQDITGDCIKSTGKTIDISIDCTGAGPFYGQENDLYIMARNLLANSVESIERSGNITIRAETKDSWLIMQVEDTGQGMPEETRRKAFQPFFTTKGIDRNLGVGLSLSEKIARTYEGDISLSARPSGGTSASVRLRSRSK